MLEIWKKIKYKLKEKNGVDTTVETSANIWIYFVILLLVLAFFSIMYKEYQLHTFATELMRTAELYGEVGDETTKRQEQLEKTLGISPKVTWSKTGTYKLNETIELSLELPLKVNVGFLKNSITLTKLTKKAIGTSEVYRK